MTKQRSEAIARAGVAYRSNECVYYDSNGAHLKHAKLTSA
jgi:hypothetical protein